MRLVALLAASFALKLAYVFFFTQYASYLFSDFAEYWSRAHQRMAGADFDYSQWSFWPPFPHIALAWYLRLAGLLGLSAHELGAALVLNVAASTAGVALIYGIALETLKSRGWALGVAALYAFTFPLVYFNAFVMSEHGATLFMLAAVWLVLRFPRHAWALLAAGVALGLATAMRPGLGVLGLPAFLYLALVDRVVNCRPTRVSLARAIVFSCGFFAVVAGTVAEVHRISRGQVLGLSANGPLSFYVAQCRTATVNFNYQGRGSSFTAPSHAGRPENGTVYFDLGSYDQRLLRDLAWRCMREEPERMRVLLQRAGDLFFGPLLPSVDSAAGFVELLPPFRWFFLVCALLAPLGFAVRSKGGSTAGVSTAALGMLGGMLGMSLGVLAVYSIEHRYLYPLLPLFYVVVAAIALAAVREPRRLLRAAGVLAALYAVAGIAAATVEAARWWGVAPAVRTEIRAFPSSPEPALAEFTARRLYSPHDPHIWHGSVAAQAVHLTCMDVRTPGLYELQVSAPGGFTLSLDGRNLMDTRLNGIYRWRTEISPGKHRYRLRMDGPLAATATWRRLTSSFSEFAPAIGLRYIGEPGEDAAFLPPDRC